MDEAALIRACVADPKENTCRLMLADWWDEFGDARRRARAEWLRFVCAAAPLRNGVSWHRGEKAWVRENSPRLWPAMAARSNSRVTGTLRPPHLGFARGKLTVAVPILYGNPPKSRASMVTLRLTRGVTEAALLPSDRLAVLGPLVARDEPHAELRFACNTITQMTVVADRWVEGGCHVVVSDLLLCIRGLGGVWERLKPGDDERISPNGTKSRVYKFRYAGDRGRFARPDQNRTCSSADDARFQVAGYVTSAYTAWAREQANLNTTGAA